MGKEIEMTIQMKKMIGGRGNERKWMPLAKRLTWCKSMRGLKEKRKRKEGAMT